MKSVHIKGISQFPNIGKQRFLAKICINFYKYLFVLKRQSLTSRAKDDYVDLIRDNAKYIIKSKQNTRVS